MMPTVNARALFCRALDACRHIIISRIRAVCEYDAGERSEPHTHACTHSLRTRAHTLHTRLSFLDTASHRSGPRDRDIHVERNRSSQTHGRFVTWQTRVNMSTRASLTRYIPTTPTVQHANGSLLPLAPLKLRSVSQSFKLTSTVT
jgi:hypothetical protein